MVNLYYPGPISCRRFVRLVFLMLSPGVIIILCHGETFFPAINLRPVVSDYGETFTDFASSSEEGPVDIHILSNDISGIRDDATNLFREISIQYTVDNRADETSNPSTISPGVAISNEAPVGEGSNQMGKFVIAGQVGDGAAIRHAFTLNLNVVRENVPPVIVGQAAISVAEDQSVEILPEDLVINDPDGTTSFSLSLEPGANYTLSGTTVTPAADFNGELSVLVIASDGELESDPFPLQITVTAVNDVPAIIGQVPDPLTTTHNQPVTIALENIVVADPDNTFPDDFLLIVLPGDHYMASGNVITPNPGFSGMLVVNVEVSDKVETSVPYPLNVSVAANAVPVITGHSPLATSEDTPLTIALTDITVSDPDSDYPEDFILKLQSGMNYTVAGEVISPAQNYAGPLSVPVIVNDGTNDSAPFNLQITVNGVNDAPVITGQVPLSTPENQAISLELSHLVIVDPDNDPASLSLSVIGGSNYTVSGNLVTPAAGLNGDLIVPVTVNDGQASSNTLNLLITVTPTNDPPQISGQRQIVIMEDTSIGLTLPDVVVTDSDNSFPEGFTLMVLAGENYAFSENTVTPLADFTGVLYVNVIVNDGTSDSEPFPLQISVTPVNDAPLIVGQQAITMSEDTQGTITLDHLVVTDPDNVYPTGFTLFLFPGEHYTLSGTTVIPAPDYSGPLTVQVQVSDGVATSNVFNLSVQVVTANDKPVITGQVPVATGEDIPFTIELSHLTVLDTDHVYPIGFSLFVSPGAGYIVTGTTVTPVADFNGTLNVAVTVTDGVSTSDVFLFQIQVGDANDAPTIIGQASVSTDEEKPFTLTLSHLIVTDPDNVFPAGFTLLVSPGASYIVAENTITPDVNFAGVLTIPVRVNDGVNNSSTFDFKLQVNPINDPPSFAAIANQQLVENSPAGSLTITGVSKGPLENDQQLTFVANSSNTSIIEDPVIVYEGVSDKAVLSFVVKPNASGVVTVTVVAIDNGSNIPPHQNSYTATFQVEVAEINTAPTLDVIGDITVMEDAEQQNVALTGISSGAGENQTLMLVVTTNKPEFFDLLELVYSSPETSGLLRFKPKANVFGTAEFTLSLSDNGSGVSPNVNSISRKFSVIIEPVNDPPVFTSLPVTVAAVGEAYQYQIKATDPDGDRITISALQKPDWLSLSAPSNGDARLFGTPPAGTLGNTEIKLQVRDATTAADQSFSIYVNVRPEIASLSVATEEDVAISFSPGFFAGGYTDLNDNALQSVLITAVPSSGKLLLGEAALKSGDTILSAVLGQLLYNPDRNYFGLDSFGWNASDGFQFGRVPGRVAITILSINDPPEIILQEDTLHYEVNGEPAFLVPEIDIIDPDDDTLTHATVGFQAGNYRPEADVLEYAPTENIRANFDFQSGVLRFTGIAPVSEYVTALQSIRYLHQNTLDPILEPKPVYLSLHDGEFESVQKDLVIVLQYTFVEFEIPSGFTPNGDQANDAWIIDRPGGGLEEMDNAIISVYNKQGVLVYRERGFGRPWDGTWNGELLPADTYFFTIDLQLRNKKTYKGIVTILR